MKIFLKLIWQLIWSEAGVATKPLPAKNADPLQSLVF
jgi:hypothetical protein